MNAMTEVNQRMSLSTAYSTWTEKWHTPNMEIKAYADLFNDTCYLITEWNAGDTPGDNKQIKIVESIAARIFYIISTSPKPTMPLVTLASKLDADEQALGADYGDNMQFYSEMIYSLRNVGIFSYLVTPTLHPILVTILQVKGELREELDAKFAQALPQVGEDIGELDAKGYGLLPGIRFTGKSTRRETPLNAYDRKAISLVSRQSFAVDMAMVNSMEYYVPTISESGIPITLQEQEDTRTAYYRFTDMAEEADSLFEPIQLPTTQDSRGRFYNAATDPAVRLSLRSTGYEGDLTDFEYEHLTFLTGTGGK